MNRTPNSDPLNPGDFRSGYLALAGRPNVGKSTLLNRFLRQEISITTPRPQTTRNIILGVFQAPNAQIAILDTPGLFAPRQLLQRYMVDSAYRAFRDADCILFITEAGKEALPEEREALQHIFALSLPVFLALNKIDRVSRKSDLLPQMEAYSHEFPFRELFPISALNGENVPDLMESLIRSIPPSPPLFPPDFLTDRPERFFVAEIIRETAFSLLRDEIPYSVGVIIEEFREGVSPQDKDFIQAKILVDRDSQKAILVGHQGKKIKEIGKRSREKIEGFLERPVYLELRVKASKKWMENREYLKEMGYEPGP